MGALPQSVLAAELKMRHPKFDQDRDEDIPGTLLFEGKRNDSRLGCVEVPEQTKRTIESSVEKDDDKDTNDIPTTTSTTSTTKVNSLLERIRAKEHKLALDRINGNHARAKEHALLSTLPATAQTVAFVFSSARKSALFLADLTAKLVQSAKSPLSVGDAREALELLQKCVPEWIRVDGGGGVGGEGIWVVKIVDKTLSMKWVWDRIEEYRKQSTFPSASS